MGARAIRTICKPFNNASYVETYSEFSMRYALFCTRMSSIQQTIVFWVTQKNEKLDVIYSCDILLCETVTHAYTVRHPYEKIPIDFTG